MTQELPVQMHPRYAAFVEFMADCPYRKTPECMQTAFWVWCELVRVQEFFAARPDPRDEQIETLKAGLDRLHRERDSFQQQARVLAEEVERLNGLFCDVYDVVGERGAICLSIDGGNL